MEALRARLEAIFLTADGDASGGLTKSEVARVLKAEGELGGLFDEAGLAPHYAFDQLDLDRDGTITLKEFVNLFFEPVRWRAVRVKLQNVFSATDVNEDGALSRDEVISMLKSDGEFGALLEAAGIGAYYLFEQLDGDSDGEITFAEFEEAFFEPLKWKAVFDRLDSDGAGGVACSKMLALMQVDEELAALVADVCRGAPLEYVLEQLDEDCDGVVSGEEFVSGLKVFAEAAKRGGVDGGLLRLGLCDLGRTADGLKLAFLSLLLPGRDLQAIELVAGLGHLQSVDLSDNRLTDDQMVHFDALQYLLNVNLTKNKLTKFPQFEKTVFLKNIDLSRNKIAAIDCGKHKFIKSLMLDDNELTTLSGLEHCICLENLSVRNNMLSTTKHLGDIATPSTLERLLLSGNQLVDAQGLEPLQSLVLVDMSSNSLTSVAGLDNHKLLLDLFVKDNAITGDLDAQIDLLGTIPLLRTLHFQNNPVTDAEMYRYRMLYRLPTMLDLDGTEILSEEKVSAQNAHGDNATFLEDVMFKYFPPGNPAEVELFEGEFGGEATDPAGG